MWISLLFSAALLSCGVVPALSGEHSLFYTYTALSKPMELPGIYDFTALGMLDDRELDYYNSKTQEKVPKQNWMRQKMPADYWEKGTQSRKSKEQWFKVNVDILIDRMRHNKTDLHVLQWRHGCVVEEAADGTTKFLRGVDEYSYDGFEFLSFDEINSRWIAPVPAAEPTKRKWDDVAILNQYTKGYLEKECVDWLTKFMDYGQEELRTFSRPDVYIFFKKSVTNPSKLTLTCMATGFHPPEVDMQVRKLRTSLPSHMVTSSGVTPNGDGSYQIRKSLDIEEKDKDLYSCYVNHVTLEKPIEIPPGEEPCPSCPGVGVPGIIGGVIGILLTVAVVGGVYLLWKKIRKDRAQAQSNGSPPAPGAGQVNAPLILDSVVTNNPGANQENDPMLQKDENHAGPEEQDDMTPKDGSTGKDSDSGKGSSDSSPEGSQEKIGAGGVV